MESVINTYKEFSVYSRKFHKILLLTPRDRVFCYFSYFLWNRVDRFLGFRSRIRQTAYLLLF